MLSDACLQHTCSNPFAVLTAVPALFYTHTHTRIQQALGPRSSATVQCSCLTCACSASWAVWWRHLSLEGCGDHQLWHETWPTHHWWVGRWSCAACSPCVHSLDQPNLFVILSTQHFRNHNCFTACRHHLSTPHAPAPPAQVCWDFYHAAKTSFVALSDATAKLHQVCVGVVCSVFLFGCARGSVCMLFECGWVGGWLSALTD